MHCSVEKQLNPDFSQVQRNHPPLAFFRRRRRCSCSNRSRSSATDFANVNFRSILFSWVFIFSGIDAKRTNESSSLADPVGHGQLESRSLTTPTLFLSKIYYHQDDEDAGISRTFDKHDSLQMPRSTRSGDYRRTVLPFKNSYISGNSSANVTHYDDDDDVNNDYVDVKFGRERRQIVPLPRSTVKPFIETRKSLLQEVRRTINTFKSFLVDYAFKREWDRAKFLVPNDEVGLMLCQDFNDAVLLSKASLYLECFQKSMRSWFSGGRRREYKPIIIAHFMNNKLENGTRQSINPHLLINYSPQRPILVLAGNESIYEILEQNKPETTNNNYKWTLVKLVSQRNNHTSKKRKIVNERLEIYDVLGFASSSECLVQLIGEWSEEDGLRIDEVKSHGVYSFEKYKLRVTTISGPPVVNLHKTPLSLFNNNRFQLDATGYLPDLFDLVAMPHAQIPIAMMIFCILEKRYEILTPKDRKFGEQGENGNWTGMIGMLQRNEADIALMSISYTKTRKSVMEYSPPVEYSSTRFLIRRDWQPAGLKWDAFIRPFEWKVWMTIAVLIALGTLTLVTFVRFNLLKFTTGQSVWLLSTCFLSQGQSEHSTIQVTPFRIVVGTFWILAVFVFACYTARLTSFLAADTDKTPVKDFSEAVRNSRWKIGLVNGSSFLEKVKDSADKEMSLLYRHIQKDSSVMVDGIFDGVKRVFKERYIFFTSELIPSFLVKGNCSYTWLPGKYFPGFGSLGYQKGLPYASGISHVIAKLRETGLMKRTFKKWWGISSTCNLKGTDAFSAISLNESGSAFLILFVGAILAIFFAISESILLRRKWRNQMNSNLAQLSRKEFAAPVVHGTVKSLTHPMILDDDVPFVWSVRDYGFERPD